MANKVSYYKIIDGLNFDSELLDMADELVKGQGDGRISVDDSNKLLAKIFDGRVVTKVEARTILYILKNFKLTNEATQNFLDKLIKFD
jgi:transcriptional regulator CtsR